MNLVRWLSYGTSIFTFMIIIRGLTLKVYWSLTKRVSSRSLILSWNQFSGVIPRELVACAQVDTRTHAFLTFQFINSPQNMTATYSYVCWIFIIIVWQGWVHNNFFRPTIMMKIQCLIFLKRVPLELTESSQLKGSKTVCGRWYDFSSESILFLPHCSSRPTSQCPRSFLMVEEFKAVLLVLCRLFSFGVSIFCTLTPQLYFSIDILRVRAMTLEKDTRRSTTRAYR